MRKTVLAAVLLLVFCLAACGGQNAAEDAFTIRVVCESDGIWQIFYSCYLDGEYCGMGGVADLDGGELTEETDLSISFTRSFLGQDADISQFSMDFSPYGQDDTSEIGTTNRVAIRAEYGQSYMVFLSGDRDSGFQAALGTP